MTANKTTIIFWLSVAFMIVVMFVFYFNNVYKSKSKLSESKESIFNLTYNDIEENNILKLAGKVSFYWDTLLSPQDIYNSNLAPDGYVHIPGEWDGMEINGTEIGGHGYGTYHFKIKVPQDNYYGFKIKDFKSAYEIWIDGESYGGAGTVGRNKKEMKPSRERMEYYFHSKNREIDVVIQISNFHHRNGGAIDTIIFGKHDKIATYKILQTSIDVFIFGILFILFVYHLALYAYRKKDISILFFSLLCFTMMLRLGYTGEKILLSIAPFITWPVAIRIEYISFMAIPIFTALFLEKLFPSEIHRTVVKILNTCCLTAAAVVLLAPPTVFSYTPIPIQLIAALAAIYLLVKVFFAMIRGRNYALSILLGYLFFMLFSFNDVLYYYNTIESEYLMPVGLFIVTLSQAYVLARKTSTAFVEVEMLSDELASHAEKLEGIVNERTKQIISQKEEIEKNAKELKATNERLITLANYKKDMTGMMVHDLKTPLSNILGFTSLPNGLDKYREVIHASGWEMQNLIKNILDVEKYESTKMELLPKLSPLKEIVDHAYKQTSYMIIQKNISFNNLIDKDLLLVIDPDLFLRVFENILSNAAKYGRSNGVIEVSASTHKINKLEYCKIIFYNSGEPIPAEKLDNIFQKYTMAHSPRGEHSFSTGIGLTFCRMIVEAHRGKIGAESGEKEGVKFWFTVPS